MKYGYHFMDWNLWEVDELLEVTEMTKDYVHKDCFGEHVFKKEEWAWVKCKSAIFAHSTYDGKHIHTTWGYEGPYYKKNIFDTKEAADEYGHYHSGCSFF